MSSEAIPGSCLCGSVKFEVTPPFTAFRYSHCTRWLDGESLVKRFNLPGAKRFAVAFCTQCGTRVPHKTGENMLIPAGLLDGDPGARPANSIFWKSKAAWYVSPQEIPKFDEAG
jgi:hypothetical protein